MAANKHLAHAFLWFSVSFKAFLARSSHLNSDLFFKIPSLAQYCGLPGGYTKS